MERWKTGRYRSHDIELSYVRTGGVGRPIVLLHGLTGSGACWRPIARMLEGEADVVMPDARGHGGSDVSPAPYRYDVLADDVVALVLALGLEAPLLVGHSMGGLTAAVVAERLPLAGLILVDPTFLTPERQREVFASDAAAQHRRTLSLSHDALVADLRRRQPHRTPEMVELVAAARRTTDNRAFEILTPPNPDWLPLIERLTVPTLLVRGGEGGVVGPDLAAALVRANARVEVRTIPEAGHAIPFDAPARLGEMIGTFARSLGARVVHGARP